MKVGIYYRKLLLFGFIFAVVFVLVRTNFSQVMASITASASLETTSVKNLSYDPYSYYFQADLKDDGSLVYDDQIIKEAIKPRSDYDELRLIVLNEPTETYEYAKIEIKLPRKVIKLISNPQIIAVHGASPLSAQLVGGDTLVYEAQSVGQTSTVTVTAKFPKGYFSLPPSEEIARAVSSIPGVIWLFGGIILPPIAIIVFLSVLFGSRFRLFRQDVSGYRKQPPSSIAPALASILVYGRVGPRVIMSTLIDLAQRGYIDIYNRKADFVVYKKDNKDRQLIKLRNFEKILLEKIFLPKQSTVGSMDVEARVGRHLFSRKISLMYLSLYDDAQDMGYFDQSPARVHLRYRMIGIILFFLGLLGYLIFAIYAPDPKFILFFWIAIVIMGNLTISFAPQLTGFSKMGRDERVEWLRFRNFLVSNTSIKGNDELFEKYLPYAIALGVEVEWASRFVESHFIPPKWYDITMRVNGVEDFARSFIPVIDYLGDSLNVSSEPFVK